MTRRGYYLTILLLIGLVCTASLVPGMVVRAQDPSGSLQALINGARAGAGLHPLALNGQLTVAAQRHSDDMVASGNFSHTGSDGSAPAGRVSEAGYVWAAVGENIAQTWAVDAGQVFGLWMGSEGHRENMLNPAYFDMGVAVATAGDGRVFWTLLVGGAPGAVPPAQPPTAAPAPTITPLPPTWTPLPPPTNTAVPPTAAPTNTSIPLPANTLLPPTWTPISPPTQAALSAPVVVGPVAQPVDVVLVDGLPRIVEPGMSTALWFVALPADYHPVNAQGIHLLPEDGIPPALWFQIPPPLAR